MIILLSIFILSMVIWFYMVLAKKYNILDVPNHRSSHHNMTIRGGGVIFPIALLLAYFLFDFQYSWFVLSVMILSFISFLDDLFSLSKRVRFFVHFISVFLLLLELNLLQPYWLFPFLFFILVGGLNSFNFMDGINGITALYSIVTLSSLYFINESLMFIERYFILIPLIGVFVFSFLNVRKRALCFAGDVGSISIAAIILFLLFKLVIHTNNFSYFFLLLVYALDSGATVLRRMMKGENIFMPHKEHLYQQLVHKKGWSHLYVSFIFSFAQLLINFSIVFNENVSWGVYTALFVMFSYIFAIYRIKKSEK